MILMLIGTPQAVSQRLSAQFLNYIDRHKSIAIAHAQQYGIPASITLAQGLLESGAGQSNLARNAHNHFGIKCHRSWKGPRAIVGDSASSICYRQYDKDEDSFLDHARFLQGKRYARLHDLPITDYKGWAQGLSDCGYAEDKAYPALLISLIEKYELFQYDNGQPLIAKRTKLKGNESSTQENDAETHRKQLKKVEFLHHVHRKWGLHYVTALRGDTYESIALEFNLKPNKLREFNDIDDSSTVPATGDKVWVEKKARQAPQGFDFYTAREGDTPWSIAQDFGVRLHSILKYNHLDGGSTLQAGQEIKLR